MKCSEKFSLKEIYIEDLINGIRYVNKRDLYEDLNCEKVCDNVQRKLCKILNHFDKLQKPTIIRKDTDDFGDEKPTYNRKLK